MSSAVRLLGAGVSSLGLILGLASCATTRSAIRDAKGIAEAPAVLSAWHDAAARGDGDAYFRLMTDDAVFVGTDATERWTRDEFEAFAEPYFDRPGQPAWVYVPRERHMEVSDDLRVAWIDELLDSPEYGTARGTTVMTRRSRSAPWRIAHYALSFPIPNELAGEFTQRIRAYEAGP